MPYVVGCIFLAMSFGVLMFAVHVLRLALRDATSSMRALQGKLDEWDALSKGPSMTTRTLRSVVLRGEDDAP